MRDVFRGRRVFVTGHTGFKGSWLTVLLHLLGADVTGYALDAEEPSMFRALDIGSLCRSIIADIRDAERLAGAIAEAQPDFVFHLAAQPVVLTSYEEPLVTLSTNVIGTASVLDALRRSGRSCAVVIVTSDKCYENRDWEYRYREIDHLGGHDIYSTSKAAAELVVAGYRRSFFAVENAIRVASVRSGNVIGGGDWVLHRIVPDCIRALRRGEPIFVRNPRSVRPWQHVLDPITGYLQVAEKLASDDGAAFCDAWNFGPSSDEHTVEELVKSVIAAWGSGSWSTEDRDQPHEARMLRLSIEKARTRLCWRPRWSFDTAVARTVEWYKAADNGADSRSLLQLTESQIRQHAGGSDAAG
jgi:CDP-glucose 4,6-dehydratase